MSTPATTLDTAQQLSQLADWANSMAAGFHAAAIRQDLFPHAVSLSWSYEVQYNDSGYDAAVCDIDLHFDDLATMRLGSLSELEEFPTYFSEWEDFEAEDDSADDEDAQFAAYLSQQYGLKDGGDWRRLGSLVAEIIAGVGVHQNAYDFIRPPSPLRDDLRLALPALIAAMPPLVEPAPTLRTEGA